MLLCIFKIKFYAPMLPVNSNFNRLCLIIAGIPWPEVRSLPGSRNKPRAAFQMQNIVLRNRHDLLKTPWPVCASPI